MKIKIILALLLVLILNDESFSDELTKGKVQSIRQKNVRIFSNVQELFEEKRFNELIEMLDEFSKEDLNTIERSYLNNYYGNIYFSNKEYQLAIDHFEKSIEIEKGVPLNFINPIKNDVLPKLKQSFQDYLRLKNLLTENIDLPLNADHLILLETMHKLNMVDDVIQLIQRAERQFGEASLPERWSNVQIDLLVDEEPNTDKKIELIEKQIKKFSSRRNWVSLLNLYIQQTKYVRVVEDGNITEIYQKIINTYRSMYEKNMLQTDDELRSYISLLNRAELLDELISAYSTINAKGLMQPQVGDIRIYASALFKKEKWQQSIIENRKLLNLGAHPVGYFWLAIGQANLELNQFTEARLAFKEAKTTSHRYKVEAKQKLKILRKKERQYKKDNKK